MSIGYYQKTKTGFEKRIVNGVKILLKKKKIRASIVVNAIKPFQKIENKIWQNIR